MNVHLAWRTGLFVGLAIGALAGALLVLGAVSLLAVDGPRPPAPPANVRIRM